MSLLRFELYKLFSRKFIYIACVFMVVATIVPSFYRMYTTIHKSGYSQGYIAQPVTQQQFNQANQELAKFQATPPATAAQQKKMDQDYAMVSAKGQSDQFTSELTSLMKHIESLKAEGKNNFDYKVSSLEYRMLHSIKPHGYGLPDDVWHDIVGFYVVNGTVLMTGVILLGLSSVFNQEYGGMDGLIFTSKNGKRKLITAKLGASLIYIGTWSLVFTCLNIISSMALYGQLGSTSFPIQANMFDSPYALTMGQYFGVVLSYHIIGCVAFGMLILLLSSLFRSVLLPFFVGLCIMTLPMFLNITLHADSGWVTSVLKFSYGTLMQVQGMQVGGIFDHFQAENVFGYPLIYPVSIILVMAAATTLTVVGTYLRFSRHQVAS